MKCLVCSEGELHPQIEQIEYTYNGVTEKLDTHYSVCDSCGCDQADCVQIKANKRDMIAFKKRVDGLLSGLEFKVAVEKLNLTDNLILSLFGVFPEVFDRFINDDDTQSASIDTLLKVLRDNPQILETLKLTYLKESYGK